MYPQANVFRSVLDVSGIWQFRADPEKTGEQQSWYRGFQGGCDIAVPGSWNEQLEALGFLHYVGTAWYQTRIFVPPAFTGQNISLRIGSADYNARVWVNGTPVGEHTGGFLPFECDVTDVVQPGRNADVVILVDNELTAGTIPQGISPVHYATEGRLRDETYPAARFDFFPFGGIHRPVSLLATPRRCIRSFRVDTTFDETGTGGVSITVRLRNAAGCSLRATLTGNGGPWTQTMAVSGEQGEFDFVLPSCRPWSPRDPYLYDLILELLEGSALCDAYTSAIGIRQVQVRGSRLLLNGEPVYLQGFGKHEDFPVIGKGLCLPLLVKDFSLLKWINANSFRTSHYPYAEEMMAMADRQGILVIDEVPAVSLDLRHATSETLANHKNAIRELFERDYNHPSVIMWALGNEPNLVGEDGYLNGSGKQYWQQIFAFARDLDGSRPMTVPNCSRAGCDDPVFLFSDILTINRYFGWYEYPGRLEHAIRVLGREMDMLHSRYGKPLMMTEFGADAVSGMHSIGEQMFTEEYQITLLESYIRAFRAREYMVGEHVWNFADFRTPQHFRRVFLNLKGVFTRDRQPKAAAFRLKALWANGNGTSMSPVMAGRKQEANP